MVPTPTDWRRFPFGAALALLLAAAPGFGAPAGVLTRAIDVRSLSVEDAAKGLPVELRGVVVFFEPASVFIQDETSTIYFRPDALGNLQVGDVVEVKGRTRMGLFLPGIDTSPFTIVGRAPVPPGIPATFDDLASGRYHYRRVAVEGVLRSITPIDGTRSLVRLALGMRRVEIRIEAPPDATRALIDSRVRISGLAAGRINERRQLVDPFVRVNGWHDVKVFEPARPTAETPLVSADALLAFREPGLRIRRVRVQGTVTAVFPPDTVYVRQGTSAFGIRLHRPAPLSVGDQIEAVGFPEMDRYSAALGDAEILQRSPGATPSPVPIGSLDELSGQHDGELIATTAWLRDAFKSENGTTLILQGTSRTLPARLPEGIAAPEPGSQLAIVAICVVESAREGNNPFTSSPDVVTLRVRTAGDVRVVTSPPWWTARRLTGLLAALGAITLLALLWVAGLRRQVRRQTEALRRRIESEAALEERQRIAREFHDSLEQDLTGLGLRLDAAATRTLDDKGRQIIAVSRGLLARIQAETRNFVADLRESTGHDTDLASALESVVSRLDPDAAGVVRVDFSGPLPALPVATVHHLRMIARESVTNALRHAHATRITIEAGADDATLRLRISDDGRSFDVSTATLGTSGHFGCVGIRERARKIGATVEWRSAPQQGTTVEVTLPLPPTASEREHHRAPASAAARDAVHPQP